MFISKRKIKLLKQCEKKPLGAQNSQCLYATFGWKLTSKQGNHNEKPTTKTAGKTVFMRLKEMLQENVDDDRMYV